MGKSEKFYKLIYQKSKKGEPVTTQYIEAEGELWSYMSFEFFIEEYNEYGGACEEYRINGSSYRATEGRSGLLIANGHKSPDLLKEHIKITIDTDYDSIIKNIEGSIKSHGASPLYDKNV